MDVLFTIKQKHSYRNEKGRRQRLALMKNDYKIEFYFRGQYPHYRPGPRLPDNRYKRIQGIKAYDEWTEGGGEEERPEGALAPRGSIEVGTVARMLMVDGIQKKKTGKRGRPGRKVWKVFEKTRERKNKSWKYFVAHRIAGFILRGESQNIYQAYWKFRDFVLNHVRQTILTIRTPALEPATVKYKSKVFGGDRKMARKPLIETFRLLKGLRARVRKIDTQTPVRTGPITEVMIRTETRRNGRTDVSVRKESDYGEGSFLGKILRGQ